MRIGPFIGTMGAAGTLQGQVQQVTDAESAGFDSFWTPQISGVDALTMLALAGGEDTYHRGRHGGRSHLSQAPDRARAAGADDAGRDGREATARNRPVAQTRRGRSLGNVVPITCPPHGGVPDRSLCRSWKRAA